MKQLLTGLMLLVTATAASAEWTIAGVNDEIIQYVDRTTIRRNGNFVKMWDLSDYKTVKVIGGKSNYSVRAQYEYDCNQEMMRRLAVAYFSGQMGSGAVNYIDSDTEKWMPVAPMTSAKALWKIACGQ